MRKVQGLSHKEIAAQLGITVSAVERNITRGLFQFKRYVEIDILPALTSCQLALGRTGIPC